jgi:hypothetical protein
LISIKLAFWLPVVHQTSILEIFIKSLFSTNLRIEYFEKFEKNSGLQKFPTEDHLNSSFKEEELHLTKISNGNLPKSSFNFDQPNF